MSDHPEVFRCVRCKRVLPLDENTRDPRSGEWDNICRACMDDVDRAVFGCGCCMGIYGNEERAPDTERFLCRYCATLEEVLPELERAANAIAAIAARPSDKHTPTAYLQLLRDLALKLEEAVNLATTFRNEI